MKMQRQDPKKPSAPGLETTGTAEALLLAMPQPVLGIAAGGRILMANPAAEQFFAMSAALLARQPLSGVIPFGSPILSLVDQVRRSGQAASEYDIALASPKLGSRIVDAHVAMLGDQAGALVLSISERTMAQKMSRQIQQRHASRATHAMTAILAHEIKNPLAGIRGAAQLLEQNAGPEDVTLTRLIVGECDRVRALIDRMQVLSESRPLQSEALNIHEVLDQVKRLAKASFARNLRIVELYDPSLPLISGDRNQLTDAIVNIVKNAADAVTESANPEVQFMTAYRQGVHWAVEGRAQRAPLPLEVTIADNGPGIPDDLKGSLFEPFVTGKAGGTGLGLALAAKIVADHGGVIECESAPRRTVFRILLPANRS